MKGQERPNPKRRYIMRWLLSLIFVMVTLNSASAIETRTEFVTEKVCPAIAGCWMNPKTGECPDCVTETRKIVTVIEIEKKENITIAAIKFPTKENSKRECIVGVCDWLNEKD